MRGKEVYKWPRGTLKNLKERDGKGCVICWSQRGLVIHHYWESMSNITDTPYWHMVDGEPQPRFDMRWLVILCRSCHGKVHNGWGESPFMKLFHSIMEEKRR